jgi:serine protease
MQLSLIKLALVQSIALALGAAAQAATDAPDRVDTSALDAEGSVTRLIVTLDDAAGEDALRADLERTGKSLGRRLETVRRLATGGWLVESRDTAKRDAPLTRSEAELAMLELARNPAVRSVEPDRTLRHTYTPNDEKYPDQWAYYRSRFGTNTAGAWHYSTGTGVKVAVIDTGITPHSDLDANIIGGYDFITSATTARDGDGRDANPNDEGDWYNDGECSDPTGEDSSWHGSHVAGIVAAATNNWKGTAGVAYGAKVVPVRVLGKCGGSLSDVAEAIVWASGGAVASIPANPNPAKVINLSLGGYGACSATMQNAINTAVGNGAVVVVAAGNEAANVANYTPARCNNVVAVAALKNTGVLADYSNYGDKIDVAAPGTIVSTINTGTTTQVAEGYASYQGTSMAAPQVAGLAAMILAEGSYTPQQVENLMKYNGTAALDCAFDAVKSCGWGLIDALHTLRAVGQGYNGDIAASPSPASFFKPTFFENVNNYHIPAGGNVTSPNTVWGQYGANAAASTTVKFKLTVRGIGIIDPKKYKIELIAADGSVVKVLHNFAASFTTTQTVNASGEIADGLWKLRVTNSGTAGNIYIDSWSIGLPSIFSPL